MLGEVGLRWLVLVVSSFCFFGFPSPVGLVLDSLETDKSSEKRKVGTVEQKEVMFYLELGLLIFTKMQFVWLVVTSHTKIS